MVHHRSKGTNRDIALPTEKNCRVVSIFLVLVRHSSDKGKWNNEISQLVETLAKPYAYRVLWEAILRSFESNSVVNKSDI